MGHRANLIIADERSYKLFYCHWCAISLAKDLFWGLDYAIEFIYNQERVDESGWLDDAFAEGGVVIDIYNKVLLFFEGDYLIYEISLKRLYLKLLAEVWQDWEVRWAYEGIAEIADYVGYPRSNLVNDWIENFDNFTLQLPPEEISGMITVGSVVREDGQISLYSLEENVIFYLESGSRLIEAVQNEQALKQLFLDELIDEFPSEGFHLDFQTKILGFWTGDVLAKQETESEISNYWQGWQVEWWRDCYELQLEKTKGLLRFSILSRESLEDKIKEILLSDSSFNPIDTLLNLKITKGEKYTINPSTLKYAPLNLPDDIRRQILNDAFAKLQNK